jgi:hypothetical protein
LTDEGIVIAQTIRDALVGAGTANGEVMITLEMLEMIEVKFQYKGDDKGVQVCQKPSAGQGGFAVVRAACKHLVEETAKKIPLPDGMKVDTCAQQLMTFLQAVPDFKQYAYGMVGAELTSNTYTKQNHLTTIEQVVDHIAELWKDFPDTMDHSQALQLLGSTRTCIQNVQQSLSKMQSRTNIPTLRVLELSTTFQQALLNLNHKFAMLCRSRSATPDPAYECQFSEAKCGMVECLTKCAHQE